MAGARKAPALATVLGMFAMFHDALGAKVCTEPTGGVLPFLYSACVQGTGRCFAWTNAQCIDGWCKCEDSECVIDGQCVPKGECSTLTGGLCRVYGCDRWRNASCSNDHEPHCLCGPGTCPIRGECRPPGTCAKATGGTCKVLGCQDWRMATCSVPGLPGPYEEAKCMCGDGSCPINGECVPHDGCPRYTGTSCTLFLATGFFGCSAGQCSGAGSCQCPEGECFVEGRCVTASDATVRRSRAQAEALEEKPSSGRYSEVYCRAPFAFALGFAVTLTLKVSYVAVRRACLGPEDPVISADYGHLEG